MRVSDDVISMLPRLDDDFYFMNLGPIAKIWVMRKKKLPWESRFVYKGEVMSFDTGCLDQVQTHIGTYNWTDKGWRTVERLETK